MLGALSLLLASTGPKWTLTLDQSFAGKAGLAPDAKVWARDLGPWPYNDELETYTDGAANAFLDGQGHLVIEARRETRDGRSYTSARLKTQGRFAQRYGKFEAVMKLPKGQGVWPAFWMLGADIDGVSWPACGEIDAMEMIGRLPSNVYGTLHGPGFSGGPGLQGQTTNASLSTAFHAYGVEWSPTRIAWTLDGAVYATANAESAGKNPWPFEKPFFLLLNLAVGGGWPGNPDGTTVFPQRLVVDSVRVWRDASLKVDEAALARYHATRMYGAETYVAPGPFPIPGTVRAADYLPTEGKGFHDSDFVNDALRYLGPQDRPYRVDGVDVGASGLEETPYSLGWTTAGEWLTYATNAAAAGVFDVEARVASDGAGGRMTVLVDGKRVGTATVPSTLGWSTWQTVPLGRVTLKKGAHAVKLTMDSVGPVTKSTGNVASLRFTKV